VADLVEVVRGIDAHIGIIAPPPTVAQSVCDRLVEAGVRSILNFAPGGPGQSGRESRYAKVDLGLELQILAFHEQRRGEEPIPEALHA
jgi:redox-sensing transcriptional repressor